MVRAAIGLVGKLPAAADFLRIQAGAEPFQSLLGWLLDGVQRAAVRGQGLGCQMVEQGPAVQAMCYRSRRGGTVLAGALTPSADRAGRRFPIAAASEVVLDAELAAHPEALPIVLEPVWAVTSQLVLEVQGLNRAELEASAFAVDLEVNVRAALATYRNWTEELEVDELAALMFDGDGAHAAGALGLMEEAVAPYVGVDEPDTPLSLRLPLGRAGGAAVCFWLDLLVRLTRWRGTVPSFFWSHDGEAGAMMLHLGRVPPSALGELWCPTGDSDEVCDLVQPDGSFRSSFTGRWERVLSDPELSVSELLRAAGASKEPPSGPARSGTPGVR